MGNKSVLVFALVFVLLGVSSIITKVQRVEASGTIHIRADGSVEPEGAPISGVNNVTYVFTYNIVYPTYDGIMVERSNIIIDGNGYTLQGRGWGALAEGSGFNLINVENVTVRNTNVVGFYCGIHLVGSSNNNISGDNIHNNNYGMTVDSSSDNTICGNNITDNWWEGFHLAAADNNTVCGNIIANNLHYGIWLGFSSYNLIYHNNFTNNDQHVYILASGYPSFWDDGYPSGGNYWSNYTGVDMKSGFYQNETGSDGIGDLPHTIDANNVDNYPLMGMFSDFKATSEHHVQTICNSSISDFQFSDTAIFFNVTGKNGTPGFCRICIPTALMNATYRVFVNGTEVSSSLLLCSNSTHSYLYFSYKHSSQKVVIVPEFPSFLILPLFMIATLLTAIICRRKRITG